MKKIITLLGICLVLVIGVLSYVIYTKNVEKINLLSEANKNLSSQIENLTNIATPSETPLLSTDIENEKLLPSKSVYFYDGILQIDDSNYTLTIEELKKLGMKGDVVFDQAEFSPLNENLIYFNSREDFYSDAGVPVILNHFYEYNRSNRSLTEMSNYYMVGEEMFPMGVNKNGLILYKSQDVEFSPGFHECFNQYKGQWYSIDSTSQFKYPYPFIFSQAMIQEGEKAVKQCEIEVEKESGFPAN